MADVFKRTGWLVVAISLAMSVVTLAAVPAYATVLPEIDDPGIVKLGDVELNGVDPGTGSDDDLVLKSCNVTLNYFGFKADKDRISTITFHNITDTPMSLLDSPATPQYFEFTGTGDVNVLADTVTYPLVLSGPADDVLGYHIRLVVMVDAPISGEIPNTVYKTFWIPEVCEAESPIVPEEPEVPPPGVVASATTTTPTPVAATPASLPATGSADTTAAAVISLVATLMVVTSLIAKKAIVKLA